LQHPDRLMNRSNLPWSSREDKEKKIFEGKNSSSMRRNSGKKDQLSE